MNQTYKELFERVGLDEKEAEVYETLLSLGKAGVLKLLPKVSLKRGSLYNALDGLKDKGLVVELMENKKKVWQIESPDKLQTVIKTNGQRLKEAEQSLLATLPTLKSNYNLTFNRPNVRFYEGEEGIKKVADDSLTSKEEIFSYVDDEALSRFAIELGRSHPKIRERLGIKKKIIYPASEYTSKNLKTYRERPLTEIRVIDVGGAGFSTVMQIYDNKVSYITLSHESKIGVIIEDQYIYQMHRILFAQTWATAKPISSMQQTLIYPKR